MASPQADITAPSLTQYTSTSSIPLALSSSCFSRYPGTWVLDHVGVNAPGSPTRMTCGREGGRTVSRDPHSVRAAKRCAARRLPQKESGFRASAHLLASDTLGKVDFLRWEAQVELNGRDLRAHLSQRPYHTHTEGERDGGTIFRMASRHGMGSSTAPVPCPSAVLLVGWRTLTGTFANCVCAEAMPSVASSTAPPINIARSVLCFPSNVDASRCYRRNVLSSCECHAPSMKNDSRMNDRQASVVDMVVDNHNRYTPFALDTTHYTLDS